MFPTSVLTDSIGSLIKRFAAKKARSRMVEINNQRKAFLDMLAWSEGTDNGRQKTKKSWLWRHCRRKLLQLLRSPSQTCHAKPKLKSMGADATSFFPVGGMPTASSLAWKTSLSEKVRTLALQQIEAAALYLWLIVVISVRQSTVATISGLHCRALVMVSFEHKADNLIAKFKEASGTVRRDWCMSRVTAIISALVICIIVCLSWAAVITVITPLLQKPSATKCQRTEAGERGNYWHADASAWCLYARCKNTRRS